jgi:hypothetical protein
MPCPSHPPWLNHSQYIWRRTQVIKLLIMQFFQPPIIPSIDYGLNYRVVILLVHKRTDFSLHHYEQTKCGFHLASYRMNTETIATRPCSWPLKYRQSFGGLLYYRLQVSSNHCVNSVATRVHTLTLKIEAPYTSETSEISSSTTGCNNPRVELKSIINYCENIKSVVDIVLTDLILRQRCTSRAHRTVCEDVCSSACTRAKWCNGTARHVRETDDCLLARA